MIRIFLTIATLALGISAFAAPTSFESLQDEFQKSSLPPHKEALGAWAGHCIHSHEPETLWPAVYVNKAILDTASNTEKLSQTYFWEKRKEPDFFTGFSVEQLNQYGPYMNWIQKEQWSPTVISDDSLSNTFELSSGGTIIRSVRITETEFTRTYLMQVTRKTTKGLENISYCSFSKEMESKTPDENNPTFLIHTGALVNTFAEVKLPLQKRAMKTLVVRKRNGEAVTLSKIEVLLDSGKVMYFAPTSFENGDSVGFTTEYKSPFRALAIRFYVMGFASDLEIYGFQK
jgi:hypothetical protein